MYYDHDACTYYDHRVAGGLFLLSAATPLTIAFSCGWRVVFCVLRMESQTRNLRFAHRIPNYIYIYIYKCILEAYAIPPTPIWCRVRGCCGACGEWFGKCDHGGVAGGGSSGRVWEMRGLDHCPFGCLLLRASALDLFHFRSDSDFLFLYLGLV